MVMPVLFSLFIILMRNSPKLDDVELRSSEAIQYEVWWKTLIDKIKERRERMIREDKTFKSNVFVPHIGVFYAPNTTAGIRQLVEVALTGISLKRNEIYGFADCDEMRIRLEMQNYIASLCFHDVDESHHGLPGKLHFSILMPAELRFYDNTWIGDSWRIQATLDTHSSRKSNISNIKNASKYVREGFISLQHSVSFQYLLMASGNAALPKVILRPFNLNNTVHEVIAEGVDSAVLVLLIGFMFPVVILTKEIVEERELSYHYALHRVTSRTLWQFAAWYCNSFILQMISCTIFIVVLKVEWTVNTSVFKKCPWPILLLFFLCYVISVSAFSLLMAVIIRTTKLVVIIIPIYWIIVPLPLLSGQSLDTSLSSVVLAMTSYMLCNMTMYRGLKRMLSLENHLYNLSVKEYLISALVIKDITLLQLIGYFLLQTLVYLILAIILDQNIVPWVCKLIQCLPCRNQLRRAHRWNRRRQRQRQKMVDREKDTTENVSETVSRIVEYNDKKSSPSMKQFHAHTPKLLFKMPGLPAVPPLPTKKSTLTIASTDSSSSTSESSDQIAPAEQDQYAMDKQLVVWLSNNDMSRQSSRTSKGSYRLYEASKQSSEKVYESSEDSDRSYEDTDDEETDRRSRVVIEFIKVWKKFHKIFVVRNFSLKVHENELMVLLGHNAGGKTTILNMTCGRTVPSSGSILIEGHNVVKHPARALQNVGISYKNLKIFTEFTFTEHLTYICRLRGLTKLQAQKDITDYLNILHAEKLAQIPVSQLTTGHRRLLQVLCAFAGRTKIVLLDRPIEGVDAEQRRHFYVFINRERINRTILITTNSPHVASNLGDRIAILVSGKLFDCGLEKSLLHGYRHVYRLVCYLGVKCNFRLLISFFARHLPELEVESKMGDMAVFSIQMRERADMTSLYKLINLVDSKMNELHLDSFELMTTDLDQILLKAMMHTYMRGTGLLRNTLPKLANRIRAIEETCPKTRIGRFLANIRKSFAHIQVVLSRRFLIDTRCCTVPLLQIMLPSILCIWCFIMPHLTTNRTPLPTTTIALGMLKRSTILLSQRAISKPVQEAGKHYLEFATAEQLIIDLDSTEDPLNYIAKYTPKHLFITDLNFAIAAIFQDQAVEALYNNNLMHSAPVSLNLVMNALAVGFVDPSSEIIVKMELMGYSTLHTLIFSSDLNNVDWVIPLTMSLCCCYVWALPLLDFGLGSEAAYNRLELLSGMRFTTLCVAYFIYGVLVVFISIMTLNGIIFTFHRSLPMDMYFNVMFNYTMLVSGACIISINILFSFWLTELRLGYILIIAFYSIGIVFHLSHCEYELFNFDENTAKMNMLPNYALFKNLLQLNHLMEIVELCKDDVTYKTSVLVEHCNALPNCCMDANMNEAYLDLTFFTFLSIIIIWGFIYIRYGLNLTKRNPPRRRDDIKKHIDPDSCYDQTIIHFSNKTESDNSRIREKIRVRTMECPMVHSKALYIENLAVFFRAHVVLKHINMLVERYQVMSVLGVNGSGKTVLIKTILGANHESAGHISSFGKQSYQSRQHENYKLIGYCAQDCKIKEALTVIEYIQAVLTIRGLKRTQALEETINLLRIFNLYSSRFILLPYCSRGVLKRIRLALSLIGYAGLILMDEPFAYLDLSSQLTIHSLIHSQSSQGQAVLFTTSDPKYCDMASRTAVLDRTNLCVIGDRNELQVKHFMDFIVVKARIKMKALRTPDLDKDDDDLTELYKFRDIRHNKIYFEFCSIIEEYFPHAILKNTNNHIACFWLSRNMYTMSMVMETLHNNSDIFFPFKISAPCLKSLFINIVNKPSQDVQIIQDEDI
ncbi:uncharacterized protein Dmoj_GI15666 [Drosophila mojavensis]|uniref:ABC transporter domain-containing protein n=1 Tax=Drosophila mojavensis TaxID=7230 RepID=B4L424_DROMO|nr:uncharacterized protein Dmoj_GI15666 [Drosophila mojavensis]